MVRSEGNMSLKNPVTPRGIDPGTVRLVAQSLNHYATQGPCSRSIYIYQIQPDIVPVNIHLCKYNFRFLCS